MIASLSGKVTMVRLDALVLEVAGVGYLIYATPTTLASVREGAQATLTTSLVVREDSLTLFGFADGEDRTMFELVQTVSGVGPRLALAILAVHTGDSLRLALVSGDVKALTRVPGIGPKVAQRMLLELSNKVSAPVAGGASAVADTADHRDQVSDALVTLGWNAKVAAQAVDQVLAGSGATLVAVAAVPGTLRAALKILGGQRG